MKKFFAICMAAVMVLSMAACGSKEATPKLEGVETPNDILTAVWDSWAEDERFYAFGGDYNNMVENAPGAFDISDKEALEFQLICSGDAAEMIDGAATLFHGMNVNTFTGAAYSMADGADQDAFVDAMTEAIKGNQWMCGFPEKLVIAKVSEDYTVIAFGLGENIDTFSSKLTEAFPVAEVVVEEAL